MASTRSVRMSVLGVVAALVLSALPELVLPNLVAADDEPKSPAAEDEKITADSDAKPVGQRTDADFMMLSTDAFIEDDHDAVLRDSMAGLSMPSSDEHVRAGLLFRKAYAN